MYGKLTTICGPMFAGKTTELLKRILWARNGQSKAVLVLKPAFDNRYATTKIVSHDGLSVEALSISKWSDIPEALVHDAEMVCLDEVQFFSDPHFNGSPEEFEEFVGGLLSQGKEVVCSGLDMDWKGQPFPLMAAVMAMADECLKITAHCSVCGQMAPKTYKKTLSGDSVELGAADTYEPRCNHHWGR